MTSLVSFGLNAAILYAAYWLVTRPAQVPAAVVALLPTAAYVALAVACVMGVAFRRGRIVFTALALAAAYAGLRSVGAGGGFEARTVFAGVSILAPTVIAALAWLDERGTMNPHALPRAGLIAAAGGFIWWIVATKRHETTNWAYAKIVDVALPFVTPVPQIGLVAIGISVVAVAVAAAMQRSVAVAGLAWSLGALTLGLHFSAAGFGLPALFIAAGLALTVAVLQEGYRLAFLDELTGLPGRRSLDLELKSVGWRYAIAMIDVDHFKKFNDTYGHDVGDEVLRMVASRIADVRGGGKVFRYGGEEFAVLFRGKDVDHALPYLERLRARVAGHRMVIRSPDRPIKQREGKRRRSEMPRAGAVTITVSIGIAQRSSTNDNPPDVLRAADEALYRAKRGGRNRVES